MQRLNSGSLYLFQNPNPMFGNNKNNYAYITCCSSEFVPKNIAACESDPSKLNSPAWWCKLGQKTSPKQVCDCHTVKSPFTSEDKLNGISESFVFLFVTFALYLAILVMIEFGVFRKFREFLEVSLFSKSAFTDSNCQNIDEDVSKEKSRVKELMKQPHQT